MKWCFLLLFLSSCFNSDLEEGLYVKDDFRELYTQKSWGDIYKDGPYLKRITLVSTNDIHGNLAPHQEEVILNDLKSSIQVGGAAIIYRYFEILKKRYNEQLLILDAGKLYQGNNLSNDSKGLAVVNIFNKLPYDALTIGTNDFEFGSLGNNSIKATLNEDPQAALKRNISEHKSPFVVSNLIDIKTAEPIKWKNLSPYIIKDVNGVKLAIIGAISSRTPKITIKENIRGLYFQEPSQTILKYSREAREKGAQIVIALVHEGGVCGEKIAKKYNIPLEQTNFNPNYKKICPADSEIFKIIDGLPDGTIDAVVSGHSKTKIANFYKGIPIIQGFSNNRYLSRLELYYDLELKSLRTDLTKIHQPTKLCHQFLLETGDCYIPPQGKNTTQLTPAVFLGELIYPNRELKEEVQKIIQQTSQKGSQIIAHLDKELENKDHFYSALGSLLSYSLKTATDSQIGFIHKESIRKEIKSGPIRMRDLEEAVPVDEDISKVYLKGSELRTLVEIATSEPESKLGQFSGLKIVISNHVLKKRDLDGDGELESWEDLRVKSLKLSSGEAIKDNSLYSIATTSFIGLDGGSRYGFIFKGIPKKRKTIFVDTSLRESLVKLLTQSSHDTKPLKMILNSEKNWLIQI